MSDDLIINFATPLLINIPSSVDTHVVTYEIFDVDGTIIDDGNMEFVYDEVWKVPTFTPQSLDIYSYIVLKVTNSDLSTKNETIYRIIGMDSATLSSSIGIISICNDALAHLGMNPITDINGTDPSSVACNRYFLSNRDDVLRELAWGFATTIEPLEDIDDEDELILGWEFAYTYPSQALSIWNVFNEGTISAKNNQEFELYYSPSLNVKKICSNLERAYAEYTYKVSDVSIWDAKFRKALTYKLAASMAHLLIGDPNIGLRMTELYNGIIEEAKRLDSSEKKKKPVVESSYINSR